MTFLIVAIIALAALAHWCLRSPGPRLVSREAQREAAERTRQRTTRTYYGRAA
jgi:hypothetical protein